MQKPLVQRSFTSFGHFAGGHTRHRQANSSTVAARWMHKIRIWIARNRQRNTLGETAERNDDLLQDIGVSQAEALREAAKPFWQR